MIEFSLGEFKALAAKALRGVGYSWGLAEDGAFAANQLAEFGLPAGDNLLELLRAVDGKMLLDLMPDGTWQAPGPFLCPVSLGASISDQGGCDELTVGPVIAPLLTAPLLAASLASDAAGGYRMQWEGGIYYVAPSRVSGSGGQRVGPVEVAISRDTELTVIVERFGRVALESQVVEELEAFAHRTYAPATDASRAGAGSNLPDTD